MKRTHALSYLVLLLVAHPVFAQARNETVPSDSVVRVEIDSMEDFSDEPQGLDIWLGVGGGTGFLHTNKLYGLNEVTATIGGFADEAHWLQINLLYQHTPLSRTLEPEYSLQNGVAIVGLEAELKFYTPQRFSFLGHYFSFGIGLDLAFWDYESGQIATDATHGSFDYLVGYDIHLGTGFVLTDIWPLSATLDITPGIVFWSAGTEQGYSRAMLPTFIYVKARLQLSFAIASW